MDPIVIIAAVAGLLIGAGVMYAVTASRAGGKLSLGLTVGNKAAADEEFAKQLDKLLNPPPPKPDGTPVRILALLQRDGRLMDLLLEDLTGADDAAIAAAIRDVHPKVQKALNEHLDLAPVFDADEESLVTVEAGFDPSAVQLTGNVTGQPPFTGTLKHRGLRVKTVKMPPPPEGQDEMVITPAEVELG